MSFFSKTADQDKWKEKYLDLLDEQEQSTTACKEKEELLCKVIIRLTIAATGLDPLLDPHLLGIRDQLKNGINNHALKDELEKFTIYVAQIKHIHDQNQSVEIEPLFDFLLQRYTTEKQQSILKLLKKKAETAKFETSNQLFIAILETIESDIAPSAPNSIANHIDIAIVSRQLLLFLEGIEIPGIFELQAQTVKQLLAAPNQNTLAFESILDTSIKLLLKIKQHNQSEQQDIDKFLSHVTEQLAALDASVMGASTAAIESAENRSRLDKSVSEQMEELQLSSTNAVKLEPLKGIITSRLASIAKEIQEHTQKEAIQRQKTQQQLDDLVAKIKDIESESCELKSKLKIANTKAFRDTLTGLPNRNAYIERLETEFARWKRYHTPLSLIVWDIDHFKNINDNFGHKAGDKVLLLIAKQLSSHSRATDFISRFGGEEFTMLLPNTDSQSALALANQLRQVIEKTGFNASGSSVAITISCGITEFIQNDTDETAFERADQALYQAKQQGRNRCLVCNDTNFGRTTPLGHK
jgi:diguanylate cyclase